MSPAWLAPLLLPVVLLVFVSVLLLSIAFDPFSPMPFSAGLGCLVAGAALVATVLRAQGGRRPTLRFTATHFDHSLHGRLPWRQIRGMDLTWRYSRHGPVPELALYLDPGATLEGRWPLAIRLPGPELRVSLRLLGQPERIFEVALAFRDRADPPRIQKWRAGMDAEAAAVLERQQALARKSDELANRLRGGESRDQAACRVERARQGELDASQGQKRDLLLTQALLFGAIMAVILIGYVVNLLKG